ncbi:MAG: imidazoleglycerol-phosphate dehydratase HisB [Candidatus Bathyarchaeia archaeon]
MRRATVQRKTSETDIDLSFDLDGKGIYSVNSSIPFLDHMLSLFTRHGLFDLHLKAKGDVEIDYHHTVEDIGICLGQAIKKALGDMKGIQRYGTSAVPMNEALAIVAIDLSNRPYLVYNVKAPLEKVGQFDTELVPEFFRALTIHSGMTLHINVPYGENGHHIIEAVFKAFGKALDEASMVTGRFSDVMSTKGDI